ncbi:hypothetical protein ABPG77_005309 [Micractinium sp. CCAP 211/92]
MQAAGWQGSGQERSQQPATQRPPLVPPADWQGQGQERAQQPAAQRPPLVPPRLRREQQQAFVAANQEVEEQLQARDQQLADLQATLQERIAQRRRQAGRWMGSSAGAAAAGAAQELEAQQPAGQAASPDLGPLMQGGLQRKVARFGELVNSLRRSQEMRGAGSGWGRQEGQGAAAYPASRDSVPARGGSTGTATSSWEQALNVTRALCCLLALCLATSVEASGYYGGYGSRRLTGLPSAGRHLLSYYGGYGGSRKLFSYYGGYGDGSRRLMEASAMTVRPLFGGFMPAADIPVPQFLTRQLLGSSRQLASYYYGGSQRRLQSAGGRQLAGYYGYGH